MSTTAAPPETNTERIERQSALTDVERRRRMQAERDARRLADLREADEAHSDQQPHLMRLGVDAGIRVRVDCPGKEHCPLWYADPVTEDGRCGFEVEISEVGYEILEYHLGPAFWPSTNPFPVRFRYTEISDEPPEIEWWPVTPDDSPVPTEA